MTATAALATNRTSADRWVVGASLAVAVATDLAIRSGVASVAGTLLVVVTAASLTGSGRLRNPQSFALTGAAVLTAGWLTVRTSPWLVTLDLLVAFALLGAAASYARGGSLLDLSLPDAVRRIGGAISCALGAPGFLRRGIGTPAGGEGTLAVVRGLLIAAPILAVLGVLLASADAVFAGFFRLRLDPGVLVSHVLPLALGAWAVSSLLLSASAPAGKAIAPGSVGRVEAIVVLVAVNLLFGTFAVAQLVALSGAGQRVVLTAGLTYAEYARTGFFQLLAVATITLAVLLVLRAFSQRSAAFMALGEIAAALTILIVFVACRRLLLYVDAYGLTMLRLMSMAFAVWIGLVFAMLGGALVGLVPNREWFGFAAGALALAGLLVLNAVNPEAVVVRHNLARAEAGRPFDPAYASELSDDAIPVLVAALSRMPQEVREVASETICRPRYGDGRRFAGWAGFNAGRARAAQARTTECRT